eukprot:scaffold109118_cov23-Tisochrysis_lutea.AAC.1
MYKLCVEGWRGCGEERGERREERGRGKRESARVIIRIDKETVVARERRRPRASGRGGPPMAEPPELAPFQRRPALHGASDFISWT